MIGSACHDGNGTECQQTESGNKKVSDHSEKQTAFLNVINALSSPWLPIFVWMRMDVSIIYTFYVVWMWTPWIFFCVCACVCDDDDDDVLPWSAGTEAKVSYHRPPLTALILSTTALDKKPDQAWGTKRWHLEMWVGTTGNLAIFKLAEQTIVCLFIPSDYEKQETTVFGERKCIFNQMRNTLYYKRSLVWSVFKVAFSIKSFCWLATHSGQSGVHGTYINVQHAD